MAQISNIDTQDVPATVNAIRSGLMLGFIAMFLKTVNYLYVLNLSYIAFGIGVFLMLFIPIIFYISVALRQKKMLHNNATLKEVFRPIFIVIIISLTISAVYGIIYARFIDPNCLIKEREIALDFFNKRNAPQQFIQERMKSMNEAISAKLTFLSFLYSHLQDIIKHSIFGFIIALIVSRKKQVNPI